MDLAATMQALAGAGSEQSRKLYRRHGIGDAQFGVSYAALGKLAKKIKAPRVRGARTAWF